MTRLLARLQRLFVVRLVMEYANSQASNYASVIAFNAFMTMFPLILGLLAVLGIVLRNAAFAKRVAATVIGIFPGTESLNLVASLPHYAGVFGVVSILGLLWTGTNLFAALEFALDRVYDVRQRDLIPQRLMGLGMLLVFLAALLLAIGASALVAVLPFIPFVGVVVGAIVISALLMLVYRVVPNHPQRWREIWPGAVLAGCAIELLTLVWPLYPKIVHSFTAYGKTFGLFLVLATWLYLLSALMLLGAVFNELKLQRHPVPKLEQAPARSVRDDAHRRRSQLKPRRGGRTEA